MFCQQRTYLPSNVNIPTKSRNDIEIPEPVMHHHLISSSSRSVKSDVLELCERRQASKLSSIPQVSQNSLSIEEAIMFVVIPVRHEKLRMDLAFENIGMRAHPKLSGYKDFGFGPGGANIVVSAT
jgi:hypothetical protein